MRIKYRQYSQKLKPKQANRQTQSLRPTQTNRERQRSTYRDSNTNSPVHLKPGMQADRHIAFNTDRHMDRE